MPNVTLRSCDIFYISCLYIDKDLASIQADKITFKNINGEEYLLVSKDNMQANIRRLNLKGKNSNMFVLYLVDYRYSCRPVFIIIIVFYNR